MMVEKIRVEKMFKGRSQKVTFLCASCRGENSAKAKFCQWCGNQFEEKVREEVEEA